MELITVGGLALTSIYLRFTIEYRKKKKIKNKWVDLMEELKLYTKKTNFIPIVKDVKFIENGYILKVYIPTGLAPTDIENKREAIENKFMGIVTIEKIRFTNLVNIKVINKDIGDYLYKPIKTLENELFIGKTFDGENYIIDITKACHILIGGATGTGKSFLLSTMLTNLIYNSSKDIELHLLQIVKGEVAAFESCKPVKFTGKNLREVALDLTKLGALVDRRAKKFTELGVKNLSHYNKHYRNKIKRIYCIIEEISFFMVQESDNEEEKELKNKCWSAILTIVKAGRSSGIHLISVTQRSTATNLPSDVKSQLCRITFNQISSIDSRNIIESDAAITLKERECLVYGDSKTMEIIKTPTLDEDFKILNKYVPEIIIPGVEREKKLLKTETEPKVESKIEIIRITEENKEDIKLNKAITPIKKIKKGMIKL